MLFGTAKISSSNIVTETKKGEQTFLEGREGVKWELGFAFFRGWEKGFWLGTGTGIHEKKNNRKMGMGFQFEQHRLGFEKNNFLGNGIRTPPPFTTLILS